MLNNSEKLIHNHLPLDGTQHSRSHGISFSAGRETMLCFDTYSVTGILYPTNAEFMSQL